MATVLWEKDWSRHYYVYLPYNSEDLSPETLSFLQWMDLLSEKYLSFENWAEGNEFLAG